MKERTAHLLKVLIESFIETAEPVGSAFLVQQTGLGVSGATVRNELRELEESGYLTHPHTSAGRVPTEQGYQYYVEHLMEPVSLHKKERSIFDEVEESDTVRRYKELAKVAAEITGNAVVVAFNRDQVYYTGISNLFSQPEFRDFQTTVDMSAILDHCEDKMDDMFDLLSERQGAVLIGRHNPLGSACASVALKLSGAELFIILGPMRMNYQKHVSVIKHIQDRI